MARVLICAGGDVRGSAGCFGKIRRFGRTGLIAAVLLAPLFAEAQFSGPDVVAPPSVLKTPKDVLERWLKVDCSYPGLADTYRECVQIVASRLPKLDESRRHHFGEQYSPKKYLECRLGSNHGETRCDVHKLQRNPNPVYWPNPNVPMPAFPEAPKESVYRKGMSAKEYFEALCKAEAGEFIRKRANGVEGIFLLRPRSIETDIALHDRFVVEDPFGYEQWETRDPQGVLVSERRFSFLEIPTSAGFQEGRIQVNRFRWKEKPEFQRAPTFAIERGVSLSARYGYTWRGITRAMDRENLIAGSEITVVDLRLGEVVALKRGFVLGGPIRLSAGGVFWPSGQYCHGDSRSLLRITDFLVRVLRRAKPQ